MLGKIHTSLFVEVRKFMWIPYRARVDTTQRSCVRRLRTVDFEMSHHSDTTFVCTGIFLYELTDCLHYFCGFVPSRVVQIGQHLEGRGSCLWFKLGSPKNSSVTWTTFSIDLMMLLEDFPGTGTQFSSCVDVKSIVFLFIRQLSLSRCAIINKV